MSPNVKRYIDACMYCNQFRPLLHELSPEGERALAAEGEAWHELDDEERKMVYEWFGEEE